MIRFFRRSITCLIVFCMVITAIGVLSPRGILPLSVERAGTSQYRFCISGRSYRIDLRPAEKILRFLANQAEKIRSSLPVWISHLQDKTVQAWKKCTAAFGFSQNMPKQMSDNTPENARFAFTNRDNCDTMV